MTEFVRDKDCLVCGPGVLIELDASVTLKKVLVLFISQFLMITYHSQDCSVKTLKYLMRNLFMYTSLNSFLECFLIKIQNRSLLRIGEQSPDIDLVSYLACFNASLIRLSCCTQEYGLVVKKVGHEA